MRKKHIALIPAYEPGDEMLTLIQDLKGKGFEIVIVNDGSGSGYDTVFNKAGADAVLLKHDVNRGKGAALKTGLEYIYKYMAYSETVKTSEGVCTAYGKDAVIVTVDADGQHKASDALRIAEIAEQRKDALVLGSRKFEGDIPARSMAGNTITRYVYSMATGVRVRDTQTGLRAFSRDLVPALLDIAGERYEYEINVLLELAREGMPIIEEDIETIYIEDNQSSHFNTIKDSFRVYKEIIKFSASSLMSFAIDYVMFGLLLALTGISGITNGLVVSNIGARLVSAAANYTINRRFVFNSNSGAKKSAAQYFLLAAIILAGNTTVLSILSKSFGINSMIAKLITEMVFFAISYTVQKYVIFFEKDRAGDMSENDNTPIKIAINTEGRHAS